MFDKIKNWVGDKFTEAKTRIGIGLWKAKEWAEEHPEQAATITATLIGATGVTMRRMNRDVRERREERQQARKIYDHSLGSFWYLKRVPTPTEKIRIERLRRRGLPYGDILRSMNLI